MCQSPSPRGTHFYQGDGGGQPGDQRVSIPFTSGNSFLPSPLFFVDFMRVSSLDFRGIFQTILKTAVFSVTSVFLSIFIKGQNTRGTNFYKFWSFLPILAVSFQIHGFISATQYDHRSTLLTPCGFYSGDLLSLPRCIQQTFIRPMYVGRPSASADSEHSSALIAQMQATAQAASFSSSHPGGSTPYTKHGTPSVLCAAAAYRNLIGDSICNYQCPHIFIVPH